jgi:hypothetical protein
MLDLLVNEKLGVTDDVDEENVADLKLDLLLNLRRHDDEFYSVQSGVSTSFFWRQWLDDFLEARIAAERIPGREAAWGGEWGSESAVRIDFYL